MGGTTLLSLKADDMLDGVQHYHDVANDVSHVVVPEDHWRRWLVIQNDGNKVAYLAMDTMAEVHFGIRLAPGEKFEQMLCTSNLCGCPISAICDGTTELLITVGV